MLGLKYNHGQGQAAQQTHFPMVTGRGKAAKPCELKNGRTNGSPFAIPPAVLCVPFTTGLLEQTVPGGKEPLPFPLVYFIRTRVSLDS